MYIYTVYRFDISSKGRQDRFNELDFLSSLVSYTTSQL